MTLNYGDILKRAGVITWQHRSLWLFGFLAALVGGGGPTFRFMQFTPPIAEIPPWVIIIAAVGMLLLIILAVVLNIVSHVAIMALVGEIEAQRPAGVRQGLRLGFGRFWPYLGISLIIGVPLGLLALAMIAWGLSPLVLLLAKQGVIKAIGVALAIILLVPIIVFLILLGVVVGIFMAFFLRACVLERLGVLASIRRGWEVIRHNPGPVVVLWLITVAIGLTLGMITTPIFIGISMLVAGASVVAYALFKEAFAAALVALGLGLPVSLVLLFLAGLYTVFQSAIWTLGYLRLAEGD